MLAFWSLEHSRPENPNAAAAGTVLQRRSRLHGTLMNLSLMPLENDDLFRVRCTGPITLRGSDPQADPLAALLGPHCFSHRILLHLGGAESIDTSGIAWLTRLRNSFQLAGGTVVPYQVPPIVTGMLDFLGVTRLLGIAPNADAARAQALFASPPRDSNHGVLPFQAAV
jgi:hypothetical protein